MKTNWTIELKNKKDSFFLEATPTALLPEYIGMRTTELTEKIMNLETEQILINLEDEAFYKLKRQLRDEEKRRNSTRASVHDYDYIQNKRAF